MTGAVVVYLVYVVLAMALIVWLGMVLHRDGRIFVDDVFRTQNDLAHAVSRLLFTGFVLFTSGYALLLLRIDPRATTIEAVRQAARQFAFLLLSLGVLHSLNMLILLQVRKRLAGRDTGDGAGPADRRRRASRR